MYVICIKWNKAGEHEIFIRQALSKKFGLKSWNDKSEKLPVAMVLACRQLYISICAMTYTQWNSLQFCIDRLL